MQKNYVYKIDHDRGFAPNPDDGICTLSGCKKTTIEIWAKRGSWVIGIGGNGTDKTNKLIYAMEVEDNLSYSEFKERYPDKSKYLQIKDAGTNVLLSRKFHYFGASAIDLPEELKRIFINRGCKKVTPEEICILKNHIEKCGYTKYGKHGEPITKNAKNCHHQCGC